MIVTSTITDGTVHLGNTIFRYSQLNPNNYSMTL